jgi:transcriptional regulator with XRE-family HTH domain
MKEINIARTIINMRRERELTQEDLARYIGVSKASVSKWETGQSYPDITFLPRLAAFFNISIDALMGYQPQMKKEDIRKLYLALSADFASEPFDEVLERCREIAKKYFSCFPLLFQVGALLVNNSTQSGDTEETLSVIAEAKELFIRVKKASADAELMRLALGMEAFCALALGNANEVIALLEGASNKTVSTETILAPAYQMVGRLREAKSTLQAGIYQRMVSLFGVLTDYLMLCTDEPEQFDKTYRRALAVALAFDLKNLHPSLLLKLYLYAAQGYTILEDTAKALEALEAYAELAGGDIYPLQLKGDDCFNLIDVWFDELDLGTALPRDDRIIRQSMADGVISNPAFVGLADERRFQRVAKKLQSNC